MNLEATAGLWKNKDTVENVLWIFFLLMSRRGLLLLYVCVDSRHDNL